MVVVLEVVVVVVVVVGNGMAPRTGPSAFGLRPSAFGLGPLTSQGSKMLGFLIRMKLKINENRIPTSQGSKVFNENFD